jgi:hypothetical protein
VSPDQSVRLTPQANRFRMRTSSHANKGRYENLAL